MTITRDGIRAAVGAGKISEAQTTATVALSDARRGVRENLHGPELSSFRDVFFLFAGSIFFRMTLAFGFLGFTHALRFDISDPHHMPRRASQAFWLHVFAALAIVNTRASIFLPGVFLIALGTLRETLPGGIMTALPVLPDKDSLPRWTRPKELIV